MKHHASKKPADKRPPPSGTLGGKSDPESAGTAKSGGTTAASGEAKASQKATQHKT